MKIGRTDLSQDVYVVAEIGGNHNGDPETAYRLVELAAKAGANAAKFQTYRGETLVHPSVEPLPIVKRHYPTQLARFKSLEFDDAVWAKLAARCAALGIDFLTTPFDLEILTRMAPLMPAIKISSGDLNFDSLVRAAAATGKPVILSTGMATEAEIAAAAALIPTPQRALLHCVSVYPLPPELANLRAIPALAARWPESVVGYSDHTAGIEAAAAAVALGARIVEKHFTLDKSQVPGDHALSADPEDLRQLVARVRTIAPMLGDGLKCPGAAEAEMRKKMRRGLYAARALGAGEVIGAGDILVIRPEAKLPPSAFDAVAGRRTRRALAAFDPIGLDDLT